MRTKFSAAVALLALSLAGGAALAQAPGGPPGAGPGGPPRGGGMGGFVLSRDMLVESNSFPDGGIIPAKNAGGGVQPDFKITGIPAAAQSVVLIFHDIEIVTGGASGIDDNPHWLAWNIPVTNGTAILEEGKLPAGAASGAGRGGAYMGPGAPAGVRYHHYVFDFYAINTKLDLPATANRDAVIEALKGKIVGKASYVGRFHGEQGAGGGGRGPGGPPGGGAGGPPRGPGAGGPPGAAPGGY